MAETWQQMWAIIKKQFPDAILTSAYRPGDPGYHGKGQAIDIARPYPAEAGRMLEFARWIGRNYPHSTQLIHTPGPNILNGRPFTYDGPTQRDHYNHVHWAMANMPAPPSGGAPPPPSTGTTWPLPPGHYFGDIDGPAESHGGINAEEQSHVRRIQQALIRKGYVPGVTDPNSGWADGIFGPPTTDAVTRFQRAEMPGTTRFGEVWSDDWAKLLGTSTAPTPPPPSGVSMLKNSSRNGVVPTWIVIHTAEGSLTVESLFSYFSRSDVQASSHAGADGYKLSAPWVADERAAWTLLNGNPRAFNLELCGFASWTRAEWLSTGWVWNTKRTGQVYNPRQMIRHAAQWCVQKKQAAQRIWGIDIPIVKLSPSQVGAGEKGICGHIDYTYGTGDGDHTDPGNNFPWDVLLSDINAILKGDDDMPTADEIAAATWRYKLKNPFTGYEAPAADWAVGNARVLGEVKAEVMALRAEVGRSVWDEQLEGDPLPDGTPYSDRARRWLVDRARQDGEILKRLDALADKLDEAESPPE